MNNSTTARAQIGLAYLYGIGFLAVLAALIFAPPTMDEYTQGMLQSLLGGLIVLVTQQSGYFFARQRSDTPLPGETTITTTPQKTVVTTAPGDPNVKAIVQTEPTVSAESRRPPE